MVKLLCDRCGSNNVTHMIVEDTTDQGRVVNISDFEDWHYDQKRRMSLLTMRLIKHVVVCEECGHKIGFYE